MLRIVLFAYILIVFSSHISVASVITTDGSGLTRDQAITSALRAAVEKGLGVYIESKTLVQNFQLIQDKIYSKSQGFVESYEVVPGSEKQEFGLYSLSVKAEVKSSDLRKSLSAINLLYQMQDKPRIMVLVTDQSASGSLNSRLAASLLEEKLLEKGFKVVDKEQMEKVKERDAVLAKTESEAAALGFRFGADIIITGSALLGEAQEEVLYGTKNYMVNCQAAFKAIRTDVAEVIAVANKGGVRGSPNKAEAQGFVVKKICGEAAEGLLQKLNDYWQDEVYNEKDIQVTVNGISQAELLTLENNLKVLPDVRDAVLRYFEKNTAMVDITITGLIQGLRESMTAKLPVTVTGLSARRIVLNYGQKKGSTDLTGLDFDLKEPPLAIEKVELTDLFAARQKYYAVNPAGQLVIRNNAAAPIKDVIISVSIPGYTKIISDKRIESIAASASDKMDFSVTLDENALAKISGSVTVQASVKLSWQSQGKKMTRELTRPVKINDRNAVSWADIESVPAFINPRDKVVGELAREILSALEFDADETAEKSLVQAAAVFDALAGLGLKYVKDPNGVGLGRDAVDYVQYPMETLKNRTGDCDDLSVLLASFLESIGIETALLTYPDHVLLMFNTGVFPKNSDLICPDSTRFVVHNNRIWIPVEATLLPKGSFMDAWKSASKDFAEALSGGEPAEVTGVHKAWEKFEPVSVTLSVQTIIFPKAAALNTKVSAEMATLKKDNEKLMTVLERALEKKTLAGKADIASLNRLGRIRAGKNDLKKALEAFEKAKEADSKSVATLTNLGNLHCLMGDEKKALEYLNAASSEEPSNGAVQIDLGLCLFLNGKADEAAKTIRKGRDLLGTDTSVAGLMGLDFLEKGEGSKAAEKAPASASQTVTRSRLKSLMRKALSDVPDKTLSTTVKNTMPVGGLRGADPADVKKVADILIWL